MRNWYAILIGATMRPQGFGSYFAGRHLSPPVLKSCGIGAWHEGSGKGVDEPVSALRVAAWSPCPLLGKPMRRGSHLPEVCKERGAGVVHLNDEHRLTRPAIAYLLYHRERELRGADEKDDALFKEIFGPLEEMDAVAEAVDPKLAGVLSK